MKNKNKNSKAFLFWLLIPLLAGFFGFFNISQAHSENHLMIFSVQNKGNEYIKLFNPNEKSISLSGLYLTYYSSSKNWSEPYRIWIFPEATNIGSKEYFLISVFESPESVKIPTIDWQLKSASGNPYTAGQLSDSAGSVAIFFWNPKDKTTQENFSNYIDVIFWGTVTCVKRDPDPGCISPLKNYSDKIIINEILPAPSSGHEEYIELYNPTAEDIDISEYILKDASKTGKYVFPDGTKVKSLDYLVIYKKDFKFALNNSGEESVTLFDPGEKIVSSVSYSGSKTDVSYNFDGSDWHWSRFLTPGEENKFNNLPEVSKKKDNKIYVGVYADFSAKGYDKDKDKLKFTWDFGDGGSKSYKKETRHKFKKAGKYKVTLKVSDGSEDKIETFTVKVEKFPKSKVKILSVSPNPKGKDSDSEFITLKNNSKKKINLKDWSVATGSKKLYNHPIYENIVIKPGKTITLTRTFSKFSLNNKKAKIELRYPTGKVASKLAYDKKKKSVIEDEIYTKESGQWAWVAPKIETKLAARPVEPSPQIALGSEASKLEDAKIILASGKNFSEDENLKKNILADFEKSHGIVLGATTFKPSISGTPQIQNKNSLWETIFTYVNLHANYLLNKLFFF